MRTRPGFLLLSAVAMISASSVGGCSAAKEAEAPGTIASEVKEADEEKEEPEENEESEEGEESAAALAAEAKITDAAARATALALVPGGSITKAELEREDGKLIYSFDITVAGKSGVEEIHVDALTGTVISQVHESPEEVAKEAESEAPATKSTAVKKP